MLVLYREDYKFLLDRCGRSRGCDARRLRSRHRLAALSRARLDRVQGREGRGAAGARAGAGRAADRHPLATATIRGSRSSRRSGRARTRSPPIATSCCARPRPSSAAPAATSISTPIPMRARCSATTMHTLPSEISETHRHLDPVRRLERRGLCRADRGPAAAQVIGDAAPISKRPRRCCGNTAAVVLGRIVRDLAQAGFGMTREARR